MESSETTNQLLKNKYDLHKAPEVDAAATRTRQRTGEKIPQDPLIRIQNYLDRINKIINPAPLEGHPRFDRQERNLTTDQIYTRADELGLDLCLPEVGVYKRLKDTEQPLGDWYVIGMKQISGRDGSPLVFDLERDEDGLWLYDHFAHPGNPWSSAYKFVFTLRKPAEHLEKETQKLGALRSFLNSLKL